MIQHRLVLEVKRNRKLHKNALWTGKRGDITTKKIYAKKG